MERDRQNPQRHGDSGGGRDRKEPLPRGHNQAPEGRGGQPERYRDSNRDRNRTGPRQSQAGRRRPSEQERAARSDPNRREHSAREPAAERRRTHETQRRKTAQKKRMPPRRTSPKPFHRRSFVLKLLTTAAVVAAIALGLTIFFKVQTITVTGNQKYTVEAVLEASGIEKGDNLLTFGKARAAGRILTELPYVSQVQIGIKLPNTVNIDIVELEVVYAIQASDDSWWLMNSAGKLLESVDAAEAEKHTQVVGIRAAQPGVGETVKAAEQPGKPEKPEEETAPAGTPADRADAAVEILKSLEKTDQMGEVARVDVSELYDIQLWYGQQYQVLLGGPTELPYKIQYMTQAVEKLADYQSGVLDLTFQEEKTARFIPW